MPLDDPGTDRSVSDTSGRFKRVTRALIMRTSEAVYPIKRGEEVSRDTLGIFRWCSTELTGSEEGLFGWDLRHLLNGLRRFAWTDVCELYRRIDRMIEIPIEDYATRVVVQPSFAPLVQLASLATNPRPLYLLGNRFGLARSFSHLHVEQQQRPDQQILITIRIPDRYEDSSEFYRVTWGILRAFPRLLGLPDAQVELDLEPRCGRYLIQPPPSMTRWARLARTLATLPLRRSVLQELTRQQNLLHEQGQELTHARTELEHAVQAQEHLLTVVREELGTPTTRQNGAAHDPADLMASIRESPEAFEQVLRDWVRKIRLQVQDTPAKPK